MHRFHYYPPSLQVPMGPKWIFFFHWQKERKEDILTSFERPKWPITPNKRLHLKCCLFFESNKPKKERKKERCIYHVWMEDFELDLWDKSDTPSVSTTFVWCNFANMISSGHRICIYKQNTPHPSPPTCVYDRSLCALGMPLTQPISISSYCTIHFGELALFMNFGACICIHVSRLLNEPLC